MCRRRYNNVHVHMRVDAYVHVHVHRHVRVGADQYAMLKEDAEAEKRWNNIQNKVSARDEHTREATQE